MVSSKTLVFHLSVIVLLISFAQCFDPPSNFTWPKNTDKLCFAATFNLTLNIRYLTTNQTNITVPISLDTDSYESYSVSCSQPDSLHALTITMLKGFTVVIFEFNLQSNNRTSLTKIHGYVTFNKDQKKFPNYHPSLEGFHTFSSNESLFQTDRATSYRCFAQTEIKDFPEEENFGVTSVDLINTRIESFVDDTKTFDNYGLETVCDADNSKDSNVVPIAVGAALGAMIVIVLIAYMIGRRRNRSNYDSI